MKFVCNQSELNNALSNVGGVVENSTVPALQGILFSANNQYLKVTGYNLETGITTTIGVHIENEGEIVLNAKQIIDIVKNLPTDVITIETDDKQICTIRSGESIFKIVGISASEYPELPTVDEGESFNIDNNILKSMVKQTRYAVAKNDRKPAHRGLLFEVNNETIRMVAVDGFRLAIRTENYMNDVNLRFIVPEKTMSELIRIINDDGKVKISVGKRQVIFEVGAYYVISRLLEGDFIDYNTAVPKSKCLTVRVNKKDLYDSIERMSLLINERLKNPVRCIFENNVIKTSCVTTAGNANDCIKANCEGDRVEIGFNNSYFLEALRATECDEVILELAGPLSPMKIMPTSGNSFLFLVLPVRLAN